MAIKKIPMRTNVRKTTKQSNASTISYAKKFNTATMKKIKNASRGR